MTDLEHARRRGLGRDRRLLVGVLVAAGLAASLVRAGLMIRGGGLSGLGAYDDGVYYAAADAFVHGRIPYRDFLLLQPPLIVLVVAPFAALGSVISDPRGFEVARVVFIAIGGMNAVVCGAVLRRFGWTAVVVGALGYAVFFPAVYSERSVLLEPLGTLGVLLAILLLQHSPAHPGLAVLAGFASGMAAGAKIWYLVPALLLSLVAHRARLRYVIGIGIGGCLVYIPFFLVAPQRMVQEVVLDQLGRGGASNIPLGVHRLPYILGAHETFGISAPVDALVLGAIAAVAVGVALVVRGGRIFGILALVTVAILLATPSWYEHYTALTAFPLVLCFGTAAGRLALLVSARAVRAAIASVVLLGFVLANVSNDTSAYGIRTPSGLTRVPEIVGGCITADDPGALIEMNVLTRDLETHDCEVWPDVTGWTYDPRDFARASSGALLPRPQNTRWQRDLTDFMESGSATVRIRASTGYSAATKSRIDSGAVLFRRGRFVVRATAGGSRCIPSGGPTGSALPRRMSPFIRRRQRHEATTTRWRAAGGGSDADRRAARDHLPRACLPYEHSRTHDTGIREPRGTAPDTMLTTVGISHRRMLALARAPLLITPFRDAVQRRTNQRPAAAIGLSSKLAPRCDQPRLISPADQPPIRMDSGSSTGACVCRSGCASTTHQPFRQCRAGRGESRQKAGIGEALRHRTR